MNEVCTPFDTYFQQYLITLFLIALSGDKIKQVSPDCDKSALHMLKKLSVLNVDKHKVLCVFNEIFCRLQLKFAPDTNLISAILGQIGMTDLI